MLVGIVGVAGWFDVYGWYCRALKSIKNTKRQAVESVNLLAEIDGYKCMDAIEFQQLCLDNFDGTRLITEALSLSKGF